MAESAAALIGREQGNELLKWSLDGKTAIVIGKGTGEKQNR